MPYRGGGTGILGIDVQEGGVSVVAAAKALNFAAADFVITDEGSDVAGIAIQGGLFLALDGSNDMEADQEVNFVGTSIITSHRNSLLISEIADPLDDGSVNTTLWRSVTTSWDWIVSEVLAPSAWYEARWNVHSVPNGYGFYRSRYSLSGDFDIRIEQSGIDLGGAGSGDMAAFFGVSSSDEPDADIILSFESGTSSAWSSVNCDLAMFRHSIIVAAGVKTERRIARIVEAGAQTVLSDSGNTSVPPFQWPAGTIFRITRIGTTVAFYVDTGGGSVLLTSGSFNAALCDVVIGFGSDGGGGGSAAGSFIAFNDFDPQSGSPTVSTSTGPTFISDSLGAVLADGESIAEIYAGPRSSVSNKRLQLLNHTDGGELRLFDEAGTSYASFLVDSNTTLRIGNAGASPGAWITLTNNILQLGIVPADFILARDTGETAGNTAKIGVPEASRRLLIADQGDVSALTNSGIAAFTHPTVTIANAGYTVFAHLFINALIPTLEADQGSATELSLRGGSSKKVNILETKTAGAGPGFDTLVCAYVQRLAISTIDTTNLNIGVPGSTRALIQAWDGNGAAGVIAIHPKAADAIIYLSNPDSAGNTHPRAGYYTSIPGTDPTTYDALIPGVRSKSGSDFAVADLRQDVDMGYRTDAPEDGLQFNIGGAIKKIGFGIGSAWGGIYNNGTVAAQSLTAGSPVLFDQFTTDFATERSITADAANNRIIINEAGTYLVTFHAHVESDTSNNLITLRAQADSVDIPMGIAETRINNPNSQSSASFTAIYTFAAADILNLLITAEENSDVTVDHCQLVVLRVA
jgi:hypothetical protein